MKRFFIFVCIAVIFTALASAPAFAIEDPIIVSNNKFGVHILFPSELQEASALINSNGGDWGYVVVPIQAGDRDLEKWQTFMDFAKKLHVVPIIRLATEGDYFNTRVWRKPTDLDIVDFANFLNSLHWPIKNRYVIVFNEPNRSDEWGGETNPEEYAKILSYAASAFKSKNQDFFVISAGLDNAAANTPHSMDQYDFLRAMNNAVPGIFTQIDGLGSHSYPNPGFSQPPSNQGPQGIGSFRYERNLISQLGGKAMPIFITETGWNQEKISDYIASLYYKDAFSSVWNDEEILVVAPFLLRAHAGPFIGFSLFAQDGSLTSQYKAIQSIPKIKGEPVTAEEDPSSMILGTQVRSQIPTRDFSQIKTESNSIEIPKSLVVLFKWLLKL